MERWHRYFLASNFGLCFFVASSYCDMQNVSHDLKVFMLIDRYTFSSAFLPFLQNIVSWLLPLGTRVFLLISWMTSRKIHLICLGIGCNGPIPFKISYTAIQRSLCYWAFERKIVVVFMLCIFFISRRRWQLSRLNLDQQCIWSIKVLQVWIASSSSNPWQYIRCVIVCHELLISSICPFGFLIDTCISWRFHSCLRLECVFAKWKV